MAIVQFRRKVPDYILQSQAFKDREASIFPAIFAAQMSLQVDAEHPISLDFLRSMYADWWVPDEPLPSDGIVWSPDERIEI